MFTQESQRPPATRRTITIPFYVAVSTVIMICAMLTVGALVLSTTDNLEKSPRQVLNDWTTNGGWKASKDVRIREALMKLPARYVASMGAKPDMPKLVIDIKFKDQENLRAKREIALQRGILIQEEGDLVPGSVRIEGRQVRVKLRLKGDQSDHYDSDKWSMRIEVKDGDHILGMRRFSIQHPKVRGYQAEPLFMETLRHAGVLGIRYQFVNVVINGEDKGIMALEEHFSKELLEKQDRREGVFVRFDETDFWEFQRVGGNWRGSAYDNFRNSRVDTFQAKKIAETPALQEQYEAAVGLLRSFTSGRIAASEVFNVEATASYLAVLELWGSWHSIQWNDLRFYFDPLTMKLEPVGYDANLQLQSGVRDVTLLREPIYAALLQDPKIRAEYTRQMRRLCRDVVDGDFGTELDELQEKLLATLRHEFLFLEPLDLQNLVTRAQFFLDHDDDRLLQKPTTYPRRIRYPALIQANLVESGSDSFVELANVLPEPVTITSIKWRDLESGVETAIDLVRDREFPYDLAATIHGRVPEFDRLYLSDSATHAGSEIIISATYANWPEIREIRPFAYYPELVSNTIPQSTVAAQLLEHPYLQRGQAANQLKLSPGSWKVESSIIVPEGFTLSAEAGTTLEFGLDASLISYGTLRFEGAEDDPVTLRGVDSGAWQGVAVLGAPGESIFRHVAVSGTTGVNRGAWRLTGGVTFYRSKVKFEDVSIAGHDGEDALNIVRTHFDISQLRVSDALSDGFDADFTTGEIRDSVFSGIGRSSGGDAIDFSGSVITVKGLRFEDIADKAVSIGEGSRARASNLTMTRVGTAAASKDGSHLDLDDVVINDVVFAGLMAYTKKPEYGPATIKATGIDYKPDGPVGRVQNGSEIELDGVNLPTEDLDVDLLYETVMRKGT